MEKSRVLICVALFHISLLSFSQTKDSTKLTAHFSGAVTVTNKGISLIPSFTLGKPALIFDINTGNKKLSFEPQIRFALEGRPWSFIFWWRYKVVNSKKFKLGVGAHPSFVFRNTTATLNGVPTNIIQTHRYFATEIVPNYFVAKIVSVGIYYLYSHGLDAGAVNNTHFITINSNFSNIKLTKQFFMKFAPQVFYLKMDNQDGYYVTSAITLAKKNLPFTIQSIMSKAINTSIVAKSDFVWNVSLIYSFNKKYVRQ